MPTTMRTRFVVAVAIVVGIVERLWVLFHVAINSDAAVTGMMAQRILRGEMFALYPDVPYGGVEPYVIAPFVWLFGSSSIAFQVAPMILAAVASLLTWRIARRLVSPDLAMIAGAISWMFPAIDVGIASTLDPEFRGVTLVCGLGCLLIAIRLLDDPRWDLYLVAFFGLLAGIGWWSSPEIVYFLVPAGLMLLAVFIKQTGLRWRLLAPGVGLVALGVGALPWLVKNVETNWSSLRPSSFHGKSTTLLGGYGVKFRVFFKYVLPMQLNLRAPTTGRWYFGPAGPAVAGVAYAVLIIAIALCLLRGGRWAALGFACVAFPFLYALSPATWYWKDGRYAIYLGPLLALLVVSGWSEAARRIRIGSLVHAVASIVLLLAVALSVASFSSSGSGLFEGAFTTRFLAGWGNPDATVDAAITSLEARHATRGYADYWVAYRLDYLSNGRLMIDSSGLDSGDPVAWRNIDVNVRGSKRSVWIFVRPQARKYFGDAEGPNDENYFAFLQALFAAHIAYQLWTDGPFWIVSAPQRIKPRTIPGSLSIGG